MCFSPEASFTASAILAATSALSIYKIISNPGSHAKYWALVVVPIGFAIQQFSEGLIWLSLRHQFNPNLQAGLISTFIFFAFIFWPAYIPTALAYFETNKTKKLILQACAAVGISTALILLTSTIYFGITAQISSCHILYTLNLGNFNSPWSYLLSITYLLATVGALLASNIKSLRILGLLTGLGYAISYVFYNYYLISIWCFFAALISILIYLVIARDLRK